MRENALIIFGAVLLIWAGMVIGISFLEAPLKFQAPHVTLTIGVGIGRIVFKALNRFEIFFSLILWVNFIFVPKKGKIIVPWAIITFILLLQTLWLLPALDIRAEALIKGEVNPESSIHLYYIVIEVIKLIALITLGIISLKKIKNL